MAMKKKSIIVAITLLACTFVSCERENIFSGSSTNNKIGVNVTGTESASTKSGASSAELIGSTVIGDVDGQDLVLNMYVEDNDILPFGESLNTKGSIVTSEVINTTGKTFAFNGWLRSTNRYPNTSGSTGPFCEDDATNYHFVSTTATKGSESWTMGQEAFWRNAVPTTFWSYYPVTDNARVLTLPGQTPTDTEQDTFSFTYTTPESAADQNDLLFAYNLHTFSAESGTTSDGETVNINFYHALSAIRFDVSGVEGTAIDVVSFTGIAVAGTCNVSGGATAAGGKTPGKVTFAWTPGTAGTRSQTLTPADFTETGLDGETENALMPLSSSKFFFFIPQEIKDKGVEISITFKNLGVDVTKTVVLDHAAWEAGKIYTYKLSKKDDLSLDVEISEEMEQNVKKNLKVENTGGVPVYVRMSIVANWVDENGYAFRNCDWMSDTDGIADKNWGNDKKWKLGSDGWFYYTNGVKSASCTEAVFTSYSPKTPPLVAGWNLSMKVIVQAVEFDEENANAIAAWGEAAASNLSKVLDE